MAWLLAVVMLLCAGCGAANAQGEAPQQGQNPSQTPTSQSADTGFPLVVTPLSQEALNTCLRAVNEGKMSTYIDPSLLALLRGEKAEYTRQTESGGASFTVVTSFDGEVYTQTVSGVYEGETVTESHAFSGLAGQMDASGALMDIYVTGCLDSDRVGVSYVGTCWSPQMLNLTAR